MSTSGPRDVNENADPSVASMTTDSAVLPDPRISELPLLDLAAFQLLEDQLDNPLIARSFARDFTKLWEKRYRTLAAAIDAEDIPAAVDAILSLKTSSTMVGGVRLATLSSQMESVIRLHDLRGAQPLLAWIAACGEATVRELELSYVLRNG